MDSYLITGGAGFIGSHFLEELLLYSNTKKIIVIDNLSTGDTENIPTDERVSFIKGDVCDNYLLQTILTENRIEYIFHLAAVASVHDSIIDPVETHRINFDSTMHLIQLAIKHSNIKRFVFAGSAAVYGDNPALPCREENAVNPISPYGVDKYASEKYIINASKLYGLPTTAFRFFNVYGPRQNPSSPYSGVISIFKERFKGDFPEIVIYGDGKQTRDFIYVKDLVKIVLKSIQTQSTLGKVYNICTNKELTLKKLVSCFENITGKKAEINYLEKRHGDIRRSYGDNSKLLKDNLISEFTLINDGLTELINYK